MKHPFKAVLFDFDGTLVEFNFPVKESRLAMIELLKKRNYDSSVWSDSMRTQDIIDQAREQWRKSGDLRSNHTFEEIKNAIFRLLDDFESNALKEVNAHRDSLPVLRKIRHAEILTGIVTNSGRAPVESVIKEFGFEPYISILVTRNEMEKLKPYPHGLLYAMQQLRVTADESLYVGDSTIDIEAARLAKMKCASVSTGLYHIDALRQHSPDFALTSLVEIEPIVLRSG
ncbi:MAG TPA: HAD family hydrolase [Nitrososphaerales archaeon]|nr:HAD family hydrolase [Nitrososphaerales archaeon]